PAFFAAADQFSAFGDEHDAGGAQVEIDPGQFRLIKWREVIDDLQIGAGDGPVCIARQVGSDSNEAGTVAAFRRVVGAVSRDEVDSAVGRVSGEATGGLPDPSLRRGRAQIERTDLPEASGLEGDDPAVVELCLIPRPKCQIDDAVEKK